MKVTLMKLNYCSGLLVMLLPVLLASCGGGKSAKNAQGQLIGVSPRPKYTPRTLWNGLCSFRDFSHGAE